MNNSDSIALSIIIPVYNTEKYLGQCLDSLLNQGNIDYEILVVDDGSTDNSLDIAQEKLSNIENARITASPSPWST